MKNLVSAIIVTYNSELETLMNQYYSLLGQVQNIIYVDNGSENYIDIYGSLDEMKTDRMTICFIHNEKNCGLGFAHNQGIEKARELNTDYVLILDHDSVLKKGFVGELLNTSHELEQKGINVGAVGPVYINEATGEVYPITKYCGPFIKRLRPTNQPLEASVLISSGTLVATSVLDCVGGMHEGLFVDYIDIEWSYRVRRQGYKLYATAAAVMNHQIGDKRLSILGRKISAHSPLRRYFLARNSIHMLRCPYISVGYKLRELTFNIFRIFIFAFISKQRIKYLKYSFRGLVDGFKGVYGDCTIKQRIH